MVARKRGDVGPRRGRPSPPGTFRTLTGEFRDGRDVECVLLDLMTSSAVTACRTRHGGELDAPMNLMSIFEIDGRRVWHEGDPNGRCEIFQAFGLKAGHIALGHLPIRLEGDAPSEKGPF